MSQKPLVWVDEAYKYLGLSEIVGVKHNSTILSWLKNLKAGWNDDEIAWCGTFVAHCLRQAGRDIPIYWYRALAYKDYGTKLNKPAYGCIAVKTRVGGGHVFFVVGITKSGKIVGLGGNQGNKVSLATFNPNELTYIWASKDGVASVPYPERFELPVYGDNLSPPSSEA